MEKLIKETNQIIADMGAGNLAETNRGNTKQNKFNKYEN